MKLKFLNISIKNYLFRLKSLILNFRKLPHSGKYLSLSLALTLIFIVLTFPYDRIILKEIHNYEGKAFRSASVRDLRFRILGNTVIEGLYIVLNNSNELNIKNVIISFRKNPWTLFVKKSLVSDFQLSGLSYSDIKSEASFNINGNTDLLFSGSGPLPVNGSVNFLISSGEINLKDITFQGPLGPMTLKIDTIQISAVNSDFDITAGVITIKKFEVTGNDLAGSVTGTIKIENFLPSSSINLTLNIDPDSGVLAQYRDIFQPLIRNNFLSFYMRGTFAKPDIRLSPGE